MALILMRHPPPAIEPGICYGASDIDLAAPLDPSLIDDLPKFDRIASSPLRRCRQAADTIGRMLETAVCLDPRLAEMNFGAWEMQPWDAIPRDQLDAWARDFERARPHGGECVADFSARVEEALAVCRAAGGDWLVVTHAGVIRAALRAWRFQIGFGEFVVV